MLAGGANQGFKGGKHNKYDLHTPMGNLLVAMLEMAGIQQDKMGDSTGKLAI